MASPAQAQRNAVIQGVCPVVEVPFTPNEEIDYPGFDHMLQQVLSTGVTAVMFPGFASEFHKLSVSEQRGLRDRTLRAVAEVDNTRVVIAVHQHATRLAVVEAASAVEAGADAINLLPSGFLGPSARAVGEHVSAVLRAVAPTPVILQHAPREVGSALTVPAIKELAGEHANLAMVKVESAPAGTFIEALLDEPHPLPSVVGYAGVQMLDAWRRGAAGVQPGCSMPEIYLDIWHRLDRGDDAGATAVHTRLLPYLSYFMSEVELMIAAEKYISVQRGWFDSERCRAPARLLDKRERDLAEALLAEFRDLLT